MNPFIGEEASDMFARYLCTIASESDRGAVLVAASLLDAGLEAVLKKKLLPEKGGDDPLFNSGYSPLRSFSSKIELAFRLGLITHKTRQMLHLFRRLRNDFAHGVDEVTLNDEAVRSRIRAMFDMQSELHVGVLETFKEIMQHSDVDVPTDFLESAQGRRAIFNAFFAVTRWRCGESNFKWSQRQSFNSRC